MDEMDALKYFNREDYVRALEMYLDMLEEAEKNEDKEKIAYNANFAGLCLYFMHRHADALKYFQIALDNTEGEENRKVRGNMDEVERFVERIEKDSREIEERLEIEEDERNKGILLSNLGILKFFLGKDDEAERSFKGAERIFKKLGDKIALGAIYTNFTMLYNDMRKLNYAYLALDIFIEEGHIKGQIDSYHTLAMYYLHQDELEEAFYFIKKELELVDQINDRELKKRVYELAADLSMEMGNVDEGMKFTERASEA